MIKTLKNDAQETKTKLKTVIAAKVELKKNKTEEGAQSEQKKNNEPVPVTVANVTKKVEVVTVTPKPGENTTRKELK